MVLWGWPSARTRSADIVLEKIRTHAANPKWHEMQKQCEKIYNQARNGEETALDFKCATFFFELVGLHYFGQSLSTLLNEDDFERFDFDNDGRLTFIEAFRCFKSTLESKVYAEAPITRDIEMLTPEQRGIQPGKCLRNDAQGIFYSASSKKYGEVALRVYHKENRSGYLAVSIQNFIDELTTLKRLNAGPYIIHSYEVFQDSGKLYCVNELSPGGDLSTLRDKTKQIGLSLTEDYFKPIFKQCMLGLKYVHMHAIVHCDIKETNIMFTNEDYVQPTIAISDLGLSMAAAGEGRSGGTLGYVPPETFAKNRWYPKGDTFSMGVTFFQLLADQVPHGIKKGIFQQGATSKHDVMRITLAREVPKHKIDQRYPRSLSWLLPMLEKDIRRRPVPQTVLQSNWFGHGKDEIEFYPPKLKDRAFCCAPWSL